MAVVAKLQLLDQMFLDAYFSLYAEGCKYSLLRFVPLLISAKVTLVVPRDRMAFSNMPERAVTDLPGGKLKEYQFMPSPKVRVASCVFCWRVICRDCWLIGLLWNARPRDITACPLDSDQRVSNKFGKKTEPRLVRGDVVERGMRSSLQNRQPGSLRRGLSEGGTLVRQPEVIPLESDRIKKSVTL